MRLCQLLSSGKRTRVLLAAMLSIGLALAGVWINTVGSSASILPSSGEVVAGALSVSAFRLGRLFVGVLIIVFARKLPEVEKASVAFVALVLGAGTGALVLAYHQTLIDASILAFGGIFAAIASYSFLVWVFYRQFALRLPTIYAVWGIFASLVLETWLSAFSCLFLPYSGQMAVLFAVPVLLAVIYFIANAVDVRPSEPKPYPRVSGKSGKLSLIAQVVLITVALVLIQALSEAGIWGESRGLYAGMDAVDPIRLIAITILMLTITFLVFHMPRKRLSLLMRCIVGLGVALLGLQMLVFADGNDAGGAFSLAAFGIEQFSHLVRWLTVIECVRLASMPSYRVAGIAHVASAMVGLLWVHFVSEMAMDNSTLVMVVIYLLLVSVIIVFMKSQYSQSAYLWMRDCGQDDIWASRFAQEHSLSPRESEIFKLLMQGLKYAEIEQACALSSGTVKTHVSNLYKKLDVHSRREMREIYDAYRMGQSEGV